MKALPAALAPWRPWLSLFAADLMAPLGELLLRLDPLVGPLRSAPARADALPEGVGSIVQRGPYERLLMTEWMIADAEPDEFIRRAANGELMFTGPEPAARLRSRRCVALFDAGPAQLGEPRLLHLALFILLARRAADAGALFEWGVLQERPPLRSGSDLAALKLLLSARTLGAAGSDDTTKWDSVLNLQQDDVWLIGVPAQARPAAAMSCVSIQRNLLVEKLDVQLQIRRTTRKLMLDLPPSDTGVRLLRTPFMPLAGKARIKQTSGRPSLQQAPRFSTCGRWIAVAQLDGSIAVHNIPQSIKTSPGKSRSIAALAAGSVLGLALPGKAMGVIASDGARLAFRGFPNVFANGDKTACERPSGDAFRAPPKIARWLPTFYVTGDNAAAVIALDLDRQLVCWRSDHYVYRRGDNAPAMTLSTIARNVIGVTQIGKTILYAEAGPQGIIVKHWNATANKSITVTSIPGLSDTAFFGDALSWSSSKKAGLIALRHSETDWRIIHGTTECMLTVEKGATVLGVATRYYQNVLIVRTANRHAIEMRTNSARYPLISSPEEIAQASSNTADGAVAWIGATSLRVQVQGVYENTPFLDVHVQAASDV